MLQNRSKTKNRGKDTGEDCDEYPIYMKFLLALLAKVERMANIGYVRDM